METVCRAYNGLLMWRTTLLCIIISRGVDMLRYLFMTLNLIIITMMLTNGYVKCATVHRYDTNKHVVLFYLKLLTV